MLITRPSLLTYPGRNPGFDLSHVAAAGIVKNRGFSAVPLGGNFVNLITGGVSAVDNSGGTAKLYGATGPIISMASNQASHFTGQLSTTTPNLTLAAIFQLTSVVSTQVLVSIGNSIRLHCSTGPTFISMIYGGNISSGYTQIANVPYFAACSLVASVVENFVIARLDTGQIYTATATPGAVQSTNTTQYVANNASLSIGCTGVAAAMFSPSYLTLGQLLEWAQDPWAFWYPRRSMFDFELIGAFTPPPPGATNHLLTLMGVGT